MIRRPESDRGHGAQYDEITKRGSRMGGKYIRRCDYVFLEENDPLKQNNKIEPISSGFKIHLLNCCSPCQMLIFVFLTSTESIFYTSA